MWPLPRLSLTLSLSGICGDCLLALFPSELMVGVDLLLLLSLFGDGLLLDLPLASFVILGE